MSKSIIRKTDRKCVLCKHWNGSVGSTTIKPKPGLQYEYDHDENLKKVTVELIHDDVLSAEIFNVIRQIALNILKVKQVLKVALLINNLNVCLIALNKIVINWICS